MKKSFYKAVSWRIIGSAPTFLISYTLSGKLAIAGGVTVAEFFGKIALYFIHERAWNKIKIGEKDV